MEDERIIHDDIPTSSIKVRDLPLYAVKNEVTREFVRVFANDREEAISIAGFDPKDVRWCWLVKTAKAPMPVAIKTDLKERKAVEKEIAGPPVPKVRVSDLLQRIWDEGRAAKKTGAMIISDIETLLNARHPGGDNVKQSKWYYHKLRRAAGVPNETMD